jgi:hypothetical protein
MDTQVIVQDLYDNFLKITGYTLQEANQNLGNEIFIDETFPKIDTYIQKKYKVDVAKDKEEVLYILDSKIINLYS